jgi:hypothetical protein
MNKPFEAPKPQTLNGFPEQAAQRRGIGISDHDDTADPLGTRGRQLAI